MIFADVVIQNKSDNTDVLYTYKSELELSKGQRVYVPFGRGNRLKAAYVISTSHTLNREIKNIKSISHVDDTLSLNDEMIATSLFMKKRYLCRLIDAVQCFVPPGQALKSGKKRVPYEAEEVLKNSDKTLTQEQKKAKQEIVSSIKEEKGELFLLKGVTGSGKTEVYMQAVSAALEIGKTAIIMVPEISLTPQTLERFFGRFGKDIIAVLHSKLSQGQRFDEWQRIRSGEARIVIGARSAVFAPLENIGIIILDEEHENSYKSDKSPKYEGVEVAIKRLKAYNGTLVLGSATPSVVSYYRATEGIFRLLEINNRYNMTPLPKVQTVDMRQELLAGNKSIISRSLYQEIDKALETKRQVILFLNRRGYSTFISCRECGYVAECEECGIAMTYHKNKNVLECHYCGRKISPPRLCPSCNSKYIKYFGAGTQKVEEYIGELFPNAKIDRLDFDTVKTKGSITKIIKDFQKGKTDILIGTQMVAKGIDVGNVALVGVITADVSLNIPDFRAAERTFQLITQAAGRAGRAEEQGKVIVQTYSPGHYAVETAAEQNYEEFYSKEIELRKLLQYPPFSDLIQLSFIADAAEIAERAAKQAHNYLSINLPEPLGENLFNIQKSYINKENGKYRYNILIKSPSGYRKSCETCIEALRQEIIKDKTKDYIFTVDINPNSFM